MEQSKFKYTSDFVEYLERVELQRDTFKRAYLLEKDKNEQLTKERDQLNKLALQLCDAVENNDDLPQIKYALRCGYLVNKLRQKAQDQINETNT